MTVHAMVDIETLSTKNDAAVIAIGLVAFDHIHIMQGYEILIDPQLAIGRRDQSTIDWWSKQDPAIRERMWSGKKDPWQACHEFIEIQREIGAKMIWANAPQFDIVILRSLFEACELEFPYKFFNERDFRTVKGLAKKWGFSNPIEKKNAHSALDDAIYQAQCLQHFWSMTSEF